MSLRIGQQLMSLSRPRVMAIINCSPDSFYTSCDVFDTQALLSRVDAIIQQGADILDVGACSTRPGSQPVDAATEWRLLQPGLELIRHHWPQMPLSVDTFRSDIAERAIAMGAHIINDVSGGDADPHMWEVVAKKRVPYVLTHALAPTAPTADPMPQLLAVLQERLDRLHRMGVADVIIDPGFGFGKTLEHNYAILQQLDILQELHAPLLVGLSRKSMLYRPLDITPQEALPATVAAQTLALERGAHILRVHDVAAAAQAIQIHQLTHNP